MSGKEKVNDIFEAAPACSRGKVFKNCHHQVRSTWQQAADCAKHSLCQQVISATKYIIIRDHADLLLSSKNWHWFSQLTWLVILLRTWKSATHNWHATCGGRGGVALRSLTRCILPIWVLYTSNLLCAWGCSSKAMIHCSIVCYRSHIPELIMPTTLLTPPAVQIQQDHSYAKNMIHPLSQVHLLRVKNKIPANSTIWGTVLNYFNTSQWRLRLSTHGSRVWGCNQAHNRMQVIISTTGSWTTGITRQLWHSSMQGCRQRQSPENLLLGTDCIGLSMQVTHSRAIKSGMLWHHWAYGVLTYSFLEPDAIYAVSVYYLRRLYSLWQTSKLMVYWQTQGWSWPWINVLSYIHFLTCN